MNAFGELGFRHPFDIQRFENECFVITDEIDGYFMSEIVPLIGNALMRSGKSFPRFRPILRSFDSSTQASAQSSDLPFTTAKEFRSRLSVPGAGDDHIFQPEVNSRTVGNENLRGFLEDAFCVDRNEPLPQMISSKSSSFDRSFDLPTLNHLHISEFRNEHSTAFDFDILGNSKRLDRVEFLFELRKSGALLKISIEGSI